MVFEDADIDKAVAGVFAGFTASSGQSCVCGSRALVQDSIYDTVVAKLAAMASTLKLGATPGERASGGLERRSAARNGPVIALRSRGCATGWQS